MSAVHIRHSTIDDLAAIRDLYAQQHAYSQTLQTPYPSDAIWEKRLHAASNHLKSLVAEIAGVLVGQLTLEALQHPRRKHVSTLGMGVSADYQGKGVGSSLLGAALEIADNWWNVTRVELEVYTDNTAAIGLYKKHGFVVEGTCRDYAFRNGQLVDTHVMARVRKPVS